MALTRETKDLAKVLSAVIQSKEYGETLLANNAENLVRGIYKGLLGREPDINGLANYSKKIVEGIDIANIIAKITSSDEFKENKLKNYKRHVPSFSATDLEESKLVFMHIPKTGGTTLHHILINSFGKDQVCPERFNGLRHYAAGELVKFRYFSGHFDLPSIRLIPGRKKIITMFREPVARLISLYYFQRAHRPETIKRNGLELARLANKYSMAEFFRADEVRFHPAVNNSMTRLLADTIEGDRWEQKARVLSDSAQLLDLALRELQGIDAFGILERYPESVELMCKTIGLDSPVKIEPRQVLDAIVNEEAGLRPIVKEPVNDEIRQLIESVVQMDIKLYKHACALFEERLATVR